MLISLLLFIIKTSNMFDPNLQAAQPAQEEATDQAAGDTNAGETTTEETQAEG